MAVVLVASAAQRKLSKVGAKELLIVDCRLRINAIVDCGLWIDAIVDCGLTWIVDCGLTRLRIDAISDRGLLSRRGGSSAFHDRD